VEELPQGPAQVDAHGSREQAAFPYHGRRNVRDGGAPLAGVEVRERLRSEPATAGRMEEQGVRVRHRGVSHGGRPFWAAVGFAAFPERAMVVEANARTDF